MAIGDIVRGLVAVLQELEKETTDGRGVSPRNTNSSLIRANGNLFARLFGQENDGNAKDVERRLTEDTKCIISKHGQSILRSDWNSATLLCYVLNAISLFIPNSMWGKNTYNVIIDVEHDYTLIPYRGKPADQCPDSPRYAALGNSMAVPVMRRIGQRIEMFHNVGTSQHPPTSRNTMQGNH